MYIYFDRNGTIKEVINDESIRRGSNDYNKIYCYLEGNPDIDDIWYLQKNPDGTLTNEVSFVDNIVTKAIPYDAKRDMKYFQDFEEYQFYVFTLSSSYLSQNGLVVATIRVAENNTLWALGELTFNVQANVINSDNEITQSQYDYLLLTISSYYSKTEIDNKLNLKADKSDTYTKTEVDGKLDLKADKSNTYTKQEINEVATSIYTYIDQVDTSLNTRALHLEDRTLNLEQDFENLKSVQNVVDVVATKSALNSYDTSKLGIDDKVQVIADESHDGASTIYNWDGTQWQYVGAFGGNSYTKAETYNKTQIDSALSDKADKSNTYTRAVIDSMILTLSTDKADKSDTYTKTEEDAKFEEVGQMFEVVGNEVLKKADKTELNNAINDLRWELGSHTLDVITDTDTKYLKSVPSGATDCQINKVGGMSYKSENLLNIADVSETTTKGITYKVENGVITLNGTSSAEVSISFNISLSLNGTYTLSAFNTFTITNSLFLITTEGNKSVYLNATNKSNSFNFSSATASQLIIYIPSGTVFSNDMFSPMLVSGSTVPTTYKPYFDGIRDSAVTSVVSKDSNNTTIDTLTIPTAIQNLDGYGWGINDTCYNYIDFENKKFVQKVARVDLGNISSWEIPQSKRYFRTYSLASQSKKYEPNVVGNGICSKLTIVSYNTVGTSGYNNSNYMSLPATNDSAIYIPRTDITTIEELITKLQGVYLYFELATPIETDISAYLTTDTIDVEPLGTLEFTNTYNNDVPSDIDYLIEEVKA